jgi:hypothetical protein
VRSSCEGILGGSTVLGGTTHNPTTKEQQLELDLDVDAGRQIELHQRIHSLWRRIDNIE